MKKNFNRRSTFLHRGALPGPFLCFGGLLMAVVAIAAPRGPFQPEETNGSWTATGSLATARFEHTATLLPNGMVLVAGGDDASGNLLASAELYDAATGSWSATGSLSVARIDHTATLLPNGLVLIAGGSDRRGYSASAELYNPSSGSWTPTGSLNVARSDHTATLLPDGKVLVVGGIRNDFKPDRERRTI